MIDIKKLRDYHKKFLERTSYLKPKTIDSFILFIEEAQKEGGPKVITREQIDRATTLRELRERQEENKMITPEDDLNSIK